MKNLIFFLLLTFCFSCSPGARLNMLIKRHPELQTKDTIRILDTITRPAIAIDTFLFLSQIKGKGIIFTKDKLTIKLQSRGDSLHIFANLPADTVFIDKEIYIDRILPGNPRKQWNMFFYGLGAGFFACLLFVIGLNIRK